MPSLPSIRKRREPADELYGLKIPIPPLSSPDLPLDRARRETAD